MVVCTGRLRACSRQVRFICLTSNIPFPKSRKKSTVSTPASGLSARRSDFHLHGQIEKVAAGARGSEARVNTLTHDMAAGFEVSSRLTNPVLNRSSCLQNKHEEMVNRARQNVSRVLFHFGFPPRARGPAAVKNSVHE